MHRLTSRQRSILDFVIERIDVQGLPPSLHEIARAFKLRSPAGVVDHLKAIERKGFIRRRPGISRGIEVVRRPAGHPAVSATVRVPVVGEVPGDFARLRRRSASDHIFFDRRVATAGTFAVRVRVDGLERRGILRGDYLVVESDVVPAADELGLARAGASTTVACLRGGSLVSLLSERSDGPEVEVLGRVVAVVRTISGLDG